MRYYREQDRSRRLARARLSAKRWRAFALITLAYALIATGVLICVLWMAQNDGLDPLVNIDIPVATVSPAPTQEEGFAATQPPAAAPTPAATQPPAAAPTPEATELPAATAVPVADAAQPANAVFGVSLTDVRVRSFAGENVDYPDMFVVVLQNEAQEATLVSATIAFVARDESGARIPISTPYEEMPESVFLGDMRNINIAPGETFGENYGWRLSDSHGIAAVEACIARATFADGTLWENPEYAGWRDGVSDMAK